MIPAGEQRHALGVVWVFPQPAGTAAVVAAAFRLAAAAAVVGTGAAAA